MDPAVCSSGSTPMLWTEYRNGSAAVNNCFTSVGGAPFSLTVNSSYFVSIVSSGNSWTARIYIGGVWQTLQTVTLSFSGSQVDGQQAIEFHTGAPSNPSLGSNEIFTGSELRDAAGNWNAWHGTSDSVYNTGSQIGAWLGFDSYWSDWSVSGTAPNFTFSASPSSISVLPGRTGSSSLTLTTNDSYDAMVPNFPGNPTDTPISMISTYASAPSVAGLPPPVSSSATESKTSLSPHARQSDVFSVSITTGLAQINSYEVDCVAFGDGITRYAVVNVTSVR